MLNAKLTLNALEDRETPAVIGWVKGGPQPEPPTIVGKISLATIDRIVLPSNFAVSPSAAPAGILFPVFVGR